MSEGEGISGVGFSEAGTGEDGVNRCHSSDREGRTAGKSELSRHTWSRVVDTHLRPLSMDTADLALTVIRSE